MAVWVHKGRGWETLNTRDQPTNLKLSTAKPRWTVRAGSQQETGPATENSMRNTPVSTPVATRRDRTDTTQNEAANNNRMWQGGRAWNRGTTRQPFHVPRARNSSVWSCNACVVQLTSALGSTRRDGAAIRRASMEVDATRLDTSTYPDTMRDTQIVQEPARCSDENTTDEPERNSE